MALYPPIVAEGQYGYDAAGRLVSIERKPDAATPGERTVYTLDAIGNRTREDLERWTGTAWETRSFTEYQYSTRCQLDAVLHPDGTKTEYAYDCEGNLERVWDASACGLTAPGIAGENAQTPGWFKEGRPARNREFRCPPRR